MSFQRFFPTVVLGLLHLGCATAPLDGAEQVAEDRERLADYHTTLPLSTNGLLPGLLVDLGNIDAMKALTSGPLSSPTPLIESKEGRLLLGYIARCALPEGELLESTDSQGNTHGFLGHVGLAPGWASGAIDLSARRWVSACLLAHANAYGRIVDILLIGAHPALGDRPTEAFSEQEAGFYGDVFQGSGVGPDLFACIGSSPGGLSNSAPPRICGRTGACGFSIPGVCGAPSPQPVCAGGPEVYAGCATDPVAGALQPSSPASSATMDEVITVYTAEGIFPGSDEDCSHPVDEAGFPLSQSCGSCTRIVCDADLYCCDTDWDEGCVAQAKSECALSP